MQPHRLRRLGLDTQAGGIDLQGLGEAGIIFRIVATQDLQGIPVIAPDIGVIDTMAVGLLLYEIPCEEDLPAFADDPGDVHHAPNLGVGVRQIQIVQDVVNNAGSE